MSGGWSLAWEGFDPEAEGVRETLCTLGNGRFCVRGALPHAGQESYPGLYLAGGYDRTVSHIADRDVENEDLVRFPCPFGFALFHAGERFTLRDAGDTAFRQVLDFERGVLSRRYDLTCGNRVLAVEEERLVSMADPMIAALCLRVRPVDWSGEVMIETSLDGRIEN